MAPNERAIITWSARIDSTAAAVQITMVRNDETKPNATFWVKLMPKARMNSGRNSDFGMLNRKNSSGLNTALRKRLSAMTMPMTTPTGTEMANETMTSSSVTAISEWIRGRCSRSHSVAKTSLAGGSRRGLTAPVRASTSQSRNSAATIASRAAPATCRFSIKAWSVPSWRRTGR